MSVWGRRAGAVGLLAMTLAAFLLFVFLGVLHVPENMPLVTGKPIFLLSWNSLAALLLFLALSFGLTGGVMLSLGRGQEIRDDEETAHREYARSVGRKLALCGTLAVPPFIILTLLSIPSTGLSLEVFAAYATVLIFATAAASGLSLLPHKTGGNMGMVFIYILMFLALVLGNRASVENAFFGWPAKVRQVAVERVPLEAPPPEIPPASEPGLEKGRAVFGSVCRACHLFDARLVGPAMKDVLPKYGGDRERLKDFIRKPGKVDPGFPAMPILGLKEDEIEAVAGYLFGLMGEKPIAKAPVSPAAAALEKGKTVFDSVCSGCHRFDTRVVGPPLNDVVPNYNGNVEWLKNFIRNPVKKDPGYPEMPKLGLKEEEIDAVARYLLSQAGKGG
jgi:cytochrome c551/c552